MNKHKVILRNSYTLHCIDNDNNSKHLFTCVIIKNGINKINNYCIKYAIVIESEFLQDLPETLKILGESTDEFWGYNYSNQEVVSDNQDLSIIEIFKKSINTNNNEYRYRTKCVNGNTPHKALQNTIKLIKLELDKLLTVLNTKEKNEKKFKDKIISCDLELTKSNKLFVDCVK